MVNTIWVFMFVAGFAVAIIEGRVDQLTSAIFLGAQSAVNICFGLISIMVFWMGLMRLAELAGLLQHVGKWLAPIVHKLFPDVPKNHPAMGYIISNMAANLFGLGNAATPLGIKAMQQLQTLNPSPKQATAAMCTLLAINTASITLIPTTMISIRNTMHAAQPAAIISPTILATAVATLAAIALDRFYRARS
jgi:spore maturation protein A